MITTSRIAAVLALAYSVPSALAATIQVTVGANGLNFDPPSTPAQPGDVIRFNFGTVPHTATQVTFDTPCSPLAGGFNSGTKTGTTQDFTVQDTNPVWFSCQVPGHCGAGMVFAVNPGVAPATNTFDAFKAIAMGGAPPPSSPSSASPSAPASGTSTGGTGYPGTTPSSAPSGSPSGSPGGKQDHRIVVGGAAGFVFTPGFVSANPGDTVTFEFHFKNHTATQSSLDAPCVRNPSGFDSGFNFASPENATTFQTYTITVNDTQPIYGYCRQPVLNHCGTGMVFVINGDQAAFDQFQARAKQLNGTAGSGSSGGPSPTRPAAAFPRAQISLVSLLSVVGVVGLML